ncbi:hypothetical protein F5X97DRAFT_60857 [Nemania serpens]|nr:hypothetical protein F5X97DRAFT_60857 [Nemania serpens]
MPSPPSYQSASSLVFWTTLCSLSTSTRISLLDVESRLGNEAVQIEGVAAHLDPKNVTNLTKAMLYMLKQVVGKWCWEMTQHSRSLTVELNH